VAYAAACKAAYTGSIPVGASSGSAKLALTGGKRVPTVSQTVCVPMKCPHCKVTFTESWLYTEVGKDRDGWWYVREAQCDDTDCKRRIVQLIQRGETAGGTVHWVNPQLVHPKGASRPLAPEIRDPFAQDFREASTVLPDSAKASAALSRRCLQSLLRDKASVKHSNLNDEIEEVLDSKQLPTWLADDLDAIRTVGNFAAHPIKSTNTGAIVDVEPGEAEWLLDVLEGLFDFYFVEPAAAKRRRDRLNEKLKKAGKPALKGT
jgi:hypothetical protein